MTIERDPRRAPPRPDLTFLRHRARPVAAAAPPVAPPVAAPAPTLPPPAPTLQPPPPLSPPAPPTATAPPPAASGSGSLLDLGPPPGAPPPAAAPSGGPSLDLHRPARPGSGSSLDLGPGDIGLAGPPPGPVGPPTRHRRLPVRDARRAPTGTVTRLTAAEPTVTLNRVQSGTGALELALTRASSAGDLSIGCVFQLADGTEAVVQSLGDATSGPTGARLPLVRIKRRGDGENLFFDLRRVTDLRRALVYGYSPSVSVLTWHGALVATTHGGARIEIPFDRAAYSGTLALLTIYHVAGELVLRAEMDEHHGPPEDAATAFDYHHPWLEGRQPLV